eukprot:2133801-Rhodomonas_salina.1
MVRARVFQQITLNARAEDYCARRNVDPGQRKYACPFWAMPHFGDGSTFRGLVESLPGIGTNSNTIGSRNSYCGIAS